MILKLGLIAFVLMVSGPAVDAISCPFGWTSFGTLCIRNIGAIDYNNAVRQCRDYGGRLFEPRNQAMSNFLYNILPQNARAWFGINNNRYASTGQIIDYSQANYGLFLAVQSKSQPITSSWFSTSSSFTRYNAYCELPRTNTECPEIDTIYVENSFKIGSSTACQEACRATHGCKFWTFNNDQCSLKFYEAGDLVDGGGPNSRTGYPTHEIPTTGKVLVGRAIKDVPNPAECQKLCQEDPKCNSYTFVVTKQFAEENICVFNYGQTKRKIPIPEPCNSIVSGPRCCNENNNCNGSSFSISTTVSGTPGFNSVSNVRNANVTDPAPLKEDTGNQELEEYFIQQAENQQ